MLNADAILKEMNRWEVDCLLIGGMNFLLNHRPETTYDIDLWANPAEGNRALLSIALNELGAEWGPTDATWGRTPVDDAWLSTQSVYCLTTPYGALDIFFDVRGLEGRYAECAAAALGRRTAKETPYLSLSDEHMLICQEALSVAEQKLSRMNVLRAAIAKRQSTP